MRVLRTVLLLVAAVCAHAEPLRITPATTLTAETSNNTSTADSWTTSTNGNLGAANVSKVDHRKLLYPGATTQIYSHMVLWYGPSNHIQVGYRSDNYDQVKKQVDDHVSRGINGTIVDWYGTSHTVDTTSARYMMQYAETLPGYPFKFALMEDKGALLICSRTPGCDLNAQLITDLTYIANTFAGSPTYIRFDGRPAIFFFGLEDYTIDWPRVKASVPGNPVFIFQNAGAFTQSASDGGFGWVMINTSDPFDWKQSYLDYFYSRALDYPSQHPVGATYKGFNDTMASWGLNRIMNQQCGQVWLNTWNNISKHYSASRQLETLQLVTWNDYEEGTAIETGIDNCLSLSASVSGGRLSWTVNGNENTLDHYQVFISTDGENLMSLAEASTGIYSLDLTQFELAPGNYTFYVKAVGKPSIVNRMSPAATLTVGNPPEVVLNVTPVAGTAPLTVTATANCGSPGPLATTIDFGQGSQVSAASASYTYSQPGSYTISATVKDGYGLSGSTTSVVTVAANQPPQAVLSLSPMSVLAGAQVTASTSDSSDPERDAITSIIDFGDGTLVAATDASHKYTSPGRYTVVATVTDSKGAQSATSTTVTVADFALSVTAGNNIVTSTQPATFTVTLTPTQQLDHPVLLTCSGLPTGYGCSFNQSSLSPASGPVSTTLTVSKTATAAASELRHPGGGVFYALCVPLAGMVLLRPARKVRTQWFAFIALLMALVVTGACGGGGVARTTEPPPARPSTFFVTISGAAETLEHSILAEVTVGK